MKLSLVKEDSIMSHFTGTHLVTPFDASKSQALTGQRLAKARYKSTAKAKAKFPSVCASVPFLPDSVILESIPSLLSSIRGMLEVAQDGILKSLYESSDGTLTQITDSDLSVAACVGYLEAESQGSRLTKEFIDAWFSQSVEEYLTVIVGQKLGFISDDAEGDVELTAEQESVIAKHVAGYKGMYSALAGGKTSYTPKQASSLIKVLELVDSDSTSEKLLSRLNSMMVKKPMEELLEL